MGFLSFPSELNLHIQTQKKTLDVFRSFPAGRVFPTGLTAGRAGQARRQRPEKALAVLDAFPVSLPRYITSPLVGRSQEENTSERVDLKFSVDRDSG